MATFKTIKDRVGWLVLRPLHSDTEHADDLMGFAINSVIRDMERRHDFGAMETTLELTTTAGTEYVTLGDSYKGMAAGKDGEGCVYLVKDGDWRRLRQLYKGEMLSLPRLRELYPDPSDTGQPKHCCLWQRRVYLGPTPEAAYGLRIPCYAYLNDLSAYTDSNWFTTALDDVAVMEAVALARLMLDEPQGAQAWSGVSAGALATAAAVDRRERTTRVGPRSAVVKAV